MHPRIVRDAYEVLGIPTTATVDEIRRAYRKLVAIFRLFALECNSHFRQALKWHPDRHIDDKEHATRVFFEVRSLQSAGTLFDRSTIQVSHAYQALADRLDFSSVPTASETSQIFAIHPSQLSSQGSTDSAVSMTSSHILMSGSNVSSTRTTPTSSLGGSVKRSPRETHKWQRTARQPPINVATSEAIDVLGGSHVVIVYDRPENIRPSARGQFGVKAQNGHDFKQ
jgi:DnaJ family protein B protein 4